MGLKNGKYDVTIIGAGPAGLACARELANSDLSVLIIDKSSQPGDKLCAGGVRVSDIKELGLDINRLKGCEILKAPDNGKIIEYTTVDRRVLSHYQFRFIDKAENIDKLSGCKMSDIAPKMIMLNCGDKIKKVFFEYLVAADGSASKVRQKIGIVNRDELILNSILSVLPLKRNVTEFSTIEFFYNRKLFGDWYAYIFPHLKLNQIKIGCGGSVRWIQQNKINLRENLKIWLHSRNLPINPDNIQGALINSDFQGYDFTKSRFGKIFLCGDAAGLANYYSGEGIHQALISGSEIGKMIVDKNYIPERLNELINRKQHEIDGLFSNIDNKIWNRFKQYLHRLVFHRF